MKNLIALATLLLASVSFSQVEGNPGQQYPLSIKATGFTAASDNICAPDAIGQTDTTAWVTAYISGSRFWPNDVQNNLSLISRAKASFGYAATTSQSAPWTYITITVHESGSVFASAYYRAHFGGDPDYDKLDVEADCGLTGGSVSVTAVLDDENDQTSYNGATATRTTSFNITFVPIPFTSIKCGAFTVDSTQCIVSCQGMDHLIHNPAAPGPIAQLTAVANADWYMSLTGVPH